MADIFLDKNTGWSKIPSLAEKIHVAADNEREYRQVGSGTRQGE